MSYILDIRNGHIRRLSLVEVVPVALGRCMLSLGSSYPELMRSGASWVSRDVSTRRSEPLAEAQLTKLRMRVRGPVLTLD